MIVTVFADKINDIVSLNRTIRSLNIFGFTIFGC